MKPDKFLLRMLGFTLDNSEYLELQKIKRATPFIPLDTTPQQIKAYYISFWVLPRVQYLKQRAKKSHHIYSLRNKIKANLRYLSVSSDTPMLVWKETYYTAKKLAKAERSLLKFRLLTLKHQIDAYTSFLHLLFGVSLFLDWSYFKLYVLLALTYPFLLDLLVIYAIKAEPDDEMIALVLEEAEAAHVPFDAAAGEAIMDEHALITQLINVKSNADEVAIIDDIEVPYDFCCAITHDIMTDPVYSLENPTRFERRAVLKWLTQRNIHPCTEDYLFPDELIRDFPLKRRIDAYVDTEIQKHEQALTQLSIFRPEEQMIDDTPSPEVEAILST